VVARVIAALSDTDADRELTTIEKELKSVETEIRRLSDAIASGGMLSGLLDALQSRERRKVELTAALVSARAIQQRVCLVKPGAIQRRAEAALRDWKGLLGRHVSKGRNILRTLLDGPIVCTPIQKNHAKPGQPCRGFAFRAQVNLGPIVAGILKIGDALGCATSMASPTGFEPVFQP
jgi:hypothetical protein